MVETRLDPSSVHLTRSAAAVREIGALSADLGGHVGWPVLLGDLGRRGRRAVAPGLAVRRSLTWDRADRGDRRWWPQGVALAPSSATGGRRVLLVAWYAKEQPGDPPGGLGVRISVIDLATGRYRHLLLVRPTLDDVGTDHALPGIEPVRAHAGGLAWIGPYLYVAATRRGIHVARIADLLRVPDGHRLDTFGYRYLLPVRLRLAAGTEKGAEPLRYSFLSHQPGSPLIAGEYGSAGQSRRLAVFDLDPETSLPREDADGRARPLALHPGGPVRMQGAVLDGERWLLTCSQGPWLPGSLQAGAPQRWRRRRLATPMGPEDIALDQRTGRLWSASEHPHRRWVFSLRV